MFISRLLQNGELDACVGWTGGMKCDQACGYAFGSLLPYMYHYAWVVMYESPYINIASYCCSRNP